MKNRYIHILTAHKVVDNRIDGAVKVAKPVGDQGRCFSESILRQFDCVSA